MRNKSDKQKIKNEMTDIIFNIAIITLNVNTLNDRDWKSGFKKKNNKHDSITCCIYEYARNALQHYQER